MKQEWLEKERVSWDEFVAKYDPDFDHVHVSAIMCIGHNYKKGVKKIDPLLLVKNTEAKKAVKKFPGIGFNKTYLVHQSLTNLIKQNLVKFGFDKHQYHYEIDFYDHQDELRQGLDFGKESYLYYFQKTLVLGVLQKTGIFISVNDKPFFIDSGKNEQDEEAKVYRLFFEPNSLSGPSAKDNKLFFALHSGKNKNLCFLVADDYKKIESAYVQGLSSSKKLLKTYHEALVEWYRMRL